MFGNTSCPYLILEKDVELFRIPFHGDNASLKSLQKGYCFVEIPNSTVYTYYRCYTCLSYLNFPLASTQLEYYDPHLYSIIHIFFNFCTFEMWKKKMTYLTM